MTTALIGTMIEPVIRNSRTSVATMTHEGGPWEASLSRVSMSIKPGGDSHRPRVEGWSRAVEPCDESDASAPCEVPVGVTSTTVRPGGLSGRMADASHAGMVESSSYQATNPALPASVSASTVMGSVPGAWEPVRKGEATCVDLEERGRVRGVAISKRALRNGYAEQNEERDGGCTDCDRVASDPSREAIEATGDVSGGAVGGILPPTAARTAGSSVTAAAMQTRTTPRRRCRMRRGSAGRTRQAAHRDGDGEGENTTVLPAVATVWTTVS